MCAPYCVGICLFLVFVLIAVRERTHWGSTAANGTRERSWGCERERERASKMRRQLIALQSTAKMCATVDKRRHYLLIANDIYR